MEEERKPRRGKKIVTTIIIVAVIAVIAVAAFWFLKNNDEETGGEVTTISEASLQKVLEISELSTIEYTYNAVAPVYEEDGSTLEYHVAYEGLVKAGIDFDAVEISVDDENKAISVTIPEIRILDYEVDAGTLDFIFENEKYDTPETATEAYKICLNDLEERAGQEGDLFTLARENALSAVKALYEPWVEQVGYTIEVN